MKKFFFLFMLITLIMGVNAQVTAQITAESFYVEASEGDTIALSGVGVITKKTVLKNKTVITCNNWFSNKKTKSVKESYENGDSHFMRYLAVGDTVDFYYASGEKFDYEVIRLRVSEKSLFWFNVPKHGEAQVLRAERGYLILDNGTIVKEDKNNQQYAVGDIVEYKKTAKPFLVKVKKRVV